MQQESQKVTPFHVPVAVVIVLAVCAALLVMNGARPGQKPASPDPESKGSNPKPSHAKPPRVGADVSSEQTGLPADDPNALGQPDNPSPLAPLGDTLEPESIGQILPEEH
jgi:hypothetical protein